MIFSFVGAQSTEANSLGSSCAYACESVSEQVRGVSSSAGIAIGFDHNSCQIDLSYGENGAALDQIARLMQDIEEDKIKVYAIIVEGAASLVGKESYNRGLAQRRAEVVRELLSTFKGSEKVQIRVSSIGENWEAFTREIVARYERPNRADVINIIVSDLSNDEKEARLANIDVSGTTFKVLVSEYMASSRNAAVLRVVLTSDVETLPDTLQSQIKAEIEALPNPPPTAPEINKSEISESETTKQTVEQPTAEPKATKRERRVKADSVVVEKPIEPRKPVVALRTNLLVPALNVGLEVPIGTNWSVGADYYYPWIWPKKDNKNCFELLSWGVEGRYWFGKERTVFDRLQGHSVGLYGYMGYYDIERNFHGHQGEFINIGVDYTYAMAVGKRKSLHFEFSLGIGYIYSQARKYTVIESQGPLISDKITKKFSFFGPTKANVSLVVPIFQKVKPSKKAKGNE